MIAGGRLGALAACVLLAALSAGCLQFPKDADFLILDLKFIEDEGFEGQVALGSHCGEADFRRGRLWLPKHYHNGLQDAGAAVIVRPESESPNTYDEGSYIAVVPATIRIGTDGGFERDVVAQINAGYAKGEWAVLLNGAEVELPYSWTHQGEGWHVDATLQGGPHSYRTESFTCD